MDHFEEWRPVVGWEAKYEVSSLGRVRTLPRWGVPGTVLKPATHAWGYQMVGLSMIGRHSTRAVHRLVGEAFLGPRPEGLETRHMDGNPANNAAANLRYGTKSENAQDRVRHGHHENTLKTECPKGHPYSGDNLGRTPDGRQRYCKTCKREKMQAYRDRKKNSIA